ncbi:hypothetical protein OIU74_025849 [Salix koriyanagi]|uniref:Amino acid transporter transmembrane domain-containing protein n=1 Tax=Salix koriyanagi TaxID=2511006 RepID=A0A9Q0W2D2_9ROSI|nr:hypothetical protein OIU74_025849 [Salix koriyanagi]
MENKQVSFLKTCINGINALSGIGILSIPYALSAGGWLSLILLILIAVAACFTGILMRRCMDRNPNVTSYSDIASHAFGRKGKLLGSLSIDGRHSVVILAGILILPTMWLSNLDVMSYVSACGVLSSLVVVVCVLCVGVTKGVGFHGKGSLINLQGVPTALSMYAFCYGAHAMFPSIYNSMRKKSQFSKVMFISFVMCTITNLSMAVLGYLIYGQNVQSQVTLNLPTQKLSSKIAIYTILAGPIAKYALTITPVAAAVESVLPDRYQDSKPIGILIRMSLLTSTAVMAMVFPSFQSVTSLSGAVLIVVVSFLLPCACYLKIFKVNQKWGIELACILTIMLMSVVGGAVGTYSSIAQTVKHN